MLMSAELERELKTKYFVPAVRTVTQKVADVYKKKEKLLFFIQFKKMIRILREPLRILYLEKLVFK